MLVGLEIPLLMRILRDRFDFKDVVAHVLTFDYLGALGASLLFPMVLVPQLGLVRSALLFGLINAGVALWTTRCSRGSCPRRRWLRGGAWLVICAARHRAGPGERITAIGRRQHLCRRDYPRARYAVPAHRADPLEGRSSAVPERHLQFSSRDEYRYHEALVHPGLSALPAARRVLVLGGGDGLAVREILKYPQVEHVTLVDLDPEMTRLFSTHPMLTH